MTINPMLRICAICRRDVGYDEGEEQTLRPDYPPIFVCYRCDEDIAEEEARRYDGPDEDAAYEAWRDDRLEER